MFIFLMIVHVIVCLILILVILLQAGRGSGLGGFMGSGAAQTVFGTRTGDFMTRATTIAAVLFLLTCLSLGVVTSRRSRSLLEGQGGVENLMPGDIEALLGEVQQAQEEIPSVDAEPGQVPEPANDGTPLPDSPDTSVFPDIDKTAE